MRLVVAFQTACRAVVAEAMGDLLQRCTGHPQSECLLRPRTSFEDLRSARSRHPVSTEHESTEIGVDGSRSAVSPSTICTRDMGDTDGNADSSESAITQSRYHRIRVVTPPRIRGNPPDRAGGESDLGAAERGGADDAGPCVRTTSANKSIVISKGVSATESASRVRMRGVRFGSVSVNAEGDARIRMLIAHSHRQSLTLPNRSRAVEHVSPLRRELESAQRILHAVVSWHGGVERGEAWIHRRGIGPESAGVAPLREYE